MSSRTFDYTIGGDLFEGYVAHPEDASSPRPVVLVVHAWRGLDDFARAKADAMADMGRIGFAIDLYGKGRRGGPPEVNRALMDPLLADRQELRRRLEGAVAEARRLPGADGTRLAAIGYCFGGLAVLDIARARCAGVRGVVSFHGILEPPSSGASAPTGTAPPIETRVLVLHGFDDPLGPPEALVAFGREMTAARADWQAHVYGGTMHAFTNPIAQAPENGTLYNPVAERRSWIAMRSFLDEVLEEA